MSHYRCFSDLHLKFGNKITLLVGDNASGKTTVLKALRSVLSTFFTGFSDDYTRFLGLTKDDFTIQSSAVGLQTDKPISVVFCLHGHEGTLELMTKKGRTLGKPLKAMRQYSKNLYTVMFDKDGNRVFALPLMACFTTEDIHSSRKLKTDPFKKYFHKPSFGYFECLRGEGFLRYWTKRLLVLKEGQKSLVEVECVRLAVQKALGKEGCNIIYDIDIRPNQGKVYYKFMDGREVDTDNLSDGYARLVNIVVDIAFRCALLNAGLYGVNSYKKTHGTVLIDEIDLHLHPSLQSVVLKSLSDTFEGLQIIVTTHAPMVMSSIENANGNSIYHLNYSEVIGYTYTIRECLYGQDASTVIESALGLSPRIKVVEEELIELFDLIDKDKFTEAKSHLDNLRARFGDHLPELSKAEAMLNLLNDTDDSDQ